MIYHLKISTPFGSAAIVFKKFPFSACRILLPRSNPLDLEKILRKSGWENSGSDEKAIALKHRLMDYFSGIPIHPIWEWLDFTELTSLQESVLQATVDIPYGKTLSYSDVAAAIGRPRACRFVGTTLAKNPFPILIPCHRVIRSDNSFGQFGGGTELKKRLIEFEKRQSFTPSR